MINQEWLGKIKAVMEAGKTKEEVYLSLLNQNWKVDDINEYFVDLEIEKKQATEKDDLQKKTILIIVTVGAILIGAGIFSFVASNWEYMTKAMKVGILIVTMLVAYLAGWLAKEKYSFPRTGTALIMLGAITYGASIFLIAQMFNVRANWPDGFILWMFGVLALGYALESFTFFILAMPIGIAAFASGPFVIFDRFTGHDPFLLTSSFLLALATVVTFCAGFTMRKKVPEEFKKYY